MGKDSGSAPSPDPNIGRAALKQAQTGEQWLAFSKDAFATSTERQKDIDALTTKVTNQQFDISNEQAGWARDDRERYTGVFQPLQDEFIEQAKNYDSPEKQAEAAATAKADVQTQLASERGTAERQMGALGINPASGRAQGIQRAGELGGALASAGAQNNARTLVKDKGIAMREAAINMGNGLPASSATATGLGINAGNSATGNMNNANGQFQNSVGIMGQGYQGAQQGYAGQASTLNNLYQNQLAGWQAQQQANASSASGIGSIVGLGLSMFSSKKLKENKKPVKEGAGLEALKKMPVEEWDYKKGVSDEGRHIGAYAEDFQKATGRGDGKTIAIQDAIGITMKAVQDLDAKVSKMSNAIGLGPMPKTSPRKPAAKSAPMKKAA